MILPQSTSEALDAVRAIKRDLEQRLTRDIAEAVVDLEQRTGMNVHGVEIEMVDVSRMCDVDKRCAVSRVRIKLAEI